MGHPGDLGFQPGRGLESSLRLDGAPAEAALNAILSAAPAHGQDNPGCCTAYAEYGMDAFLLLVHHRSGPDTPLVLRYSGGVRNGIDDGTLVRVLTRADVAPFTAPPNSLSSWTNGGPSKDAALGHPYTDEDYAHDQAKYGCTLPCNNSPTPQP